MTGFTILFSRDTKNQNVSQLTTLSPTRFVGHSQPNCSSILSRKSICLFKQHLFRLSDLIFRFVVDHLSVSDLQAPKKKDPKHWCDGCKILYVTPLNGLLLEMENFPPPLVFQNPNQYLPWLAFARQSSTDWSRSKCFSNVAELLVDDDVI
ncbi:hypothetical protein OUZ56_026054 [Daphnia magna]|uniref:Uncharacterized protein n=1 Tax=Daphnia magna TaxID=35525 RepID=A0ABQ9ZKP1_9CRUS|nr:hypothetical protein OUZ56_026054 [Daphnia magna]